MEAVEEFVIAKAKVADRVAAHGLRVRARLVAAQNRADMVIASIFAKTKAAPDQRKP